MVYNIDIPNKNSKKSLKKNFSRIFKKGVDKLKKVWYNINVVKRTTKILKGRVFYDNKFFNRWLFLEIC